MQIGGTHTLSSGHFLEFFIRARNAVAAHHGLDRLGQHFPAGVEVGRQAVDFGLLGGVSTLGIFVLGFFTDEERVSFHWPLPGYLALLVAVLYMQFDGLPAPFWVAVGLTGAWWAVRWLADRRRQRQRAAAMLGPSRSP